MGSEATLFLATLAGWVVLLFGEIMHGAAARSQLVQVAVFVTMLSIFGNERNPDKSIVPNDTFTYDEEARLPNRIIGFGDLEGPAIGRAYRVCPGSRLL